MLLTPLTYFFTEHMNIHTHTNVYTLIRDKTFSILKQDLKVFSYLISKQKWKF